MRVAFCLCVASFAVACADSNAGGDAAMHNDAATHNDASVSDSGLDSSMSDAASGDSSVVDICALPPVSGSCDAYFPRYYFNPDSGACEMFVYGGCGGNANNFETQAECEAACGAPSDGGDPGCPPNRKNATSCDECGPTDACLKTLHGCFPVCDTNADCEGTGYFFCSDHACINVCG